MKINDFWLFEKVGSSPILVSLPHDAMLHEKRDAHCINGRHTGYFPGGKYKYTKTITLKEEEIKQNISLFFEGVYQNATILVNGVKVGFNKYGFSEFTVNINDAVTVGENEICVLVDNSLEPSARWYTGSGIYRNVWLRIHEHNHPTFLKVSTLEIKPAKILVETDGELVKIFDQNIIIYEGAPGEIVVKDAKLWSSKNPYLYKIVALNGTAEKKDTFGIRKLTWNAEKGLLINNKRELLRGACVRHDHGVLGAVSYYEAEKRKVRILKEAGYNAVRCAHNPGARDFLRACDELGMYVIDELFDGWYIPKTYHDYARVFHNEWRKDLKTMIAKDFNHPSVIMYSTGNEVTETATQDGVKISQMLTNYAHSLDQTRPVMVGINVLLNVYAQMGIGVYRDDKVYKAEPLKRNKGYKERKTGSMFFNSLVQKLGGLLFFMSKGRKGDKALKAAHTMDIVGLNYASPRLKEDVKKHPKRLMVASETMVTDLPYNWKYVKKHPQIIGDFVWAGWDYLGEAGVGDWTYHSYLGLPLLAGSGTIDITGKITAEAYYQQIVWGLREKPFIGVRPLNHYKETPTKSAWRFTNCIDSWNWQGYEGKRAVVEVYADCFKVRLQINGKTVGTKKVKDYKVVFRTRYEQGTIIAIALDKMNNEINRHSLISGDGINLTAQVEQDDGNVKFVSIEYRDSNGNILPTLEQKLTVAVNDCELLGFGSALGKTNESYLDNEHTTYRGRALAVVKVIGKHPTLTINDQTSEILVEV